MDGIPFVAEARLGAAISGLTIDVQKTWRGEDALVAYHSGLGGAC